MRHKEFITQSVFILLTKLISPCASLLLSIMIARYLGVVALGQFAISGTLFICFNVVALMGLDTFVIREISKDISRSEEIFKNVFVICGVLSLVCTLGMMATANVLHYSPEIKDLIVVISLGLFPMVLCQVYEAVFIAHQKQQYYLLIVLVGNIFKVTTCFLLIVKGLQLVYLMWAIFASLILCVAGSIYFCNRKLFQIRQPWMRIDAQFLRTNLKPAVTFSLISILLAIYYRNDIILISKIRGDVETGIYSVANKILYLAQLSFLGIITTMYPCLVRYYKDSAQHFTKVYHQYNALILAAIFCFILVISLYSNPIITMFFGKKYLLAAVPLKISIWSVLPMALALYHYHVLLVLERHKDILIILGICLLLSLPISIIFTYLWGYIGISYSMIIAHSFTALCFFVYFKKEYSSVYIPNPRKDYIHG